MHDEVMKGREAYRRRAWAEACESLASADRAAPLDPENLELLAMCAYLAGYEDWFVRAFDRAHQGYRHAGEPVRAARSAFWLGFHLFIQGETGPATGWLARAQRLLEGGQHDCVERGYLLLPAAEQQLGTGEEEAAYTTASGAVDIGERFGDPDLIAAARHQQGRALVRQGDVERGLALLDEAMVAVTAGELSPVMTGLIYCSVIASCQEICALDRAREWTSALAHWCAEQPQLVAFTRTCLVHRAEVMQLQGDWRDAIQEARRACDPSPGETDPEPPGAALYQQAEVYRLRGKFAAAEKLYRSASQRGCEPQPGLALLRLAQGQTATAAAAISRVVSSTGDRLQRAKLLPAYIEIMLAVDDIEKAQNACRELEESATRFDTGAFRAMAAHARGAVELAQDAAPAALGSLQRAWQLWQQVDAPYLAARVRELLAQACRLLGDKDGARLELEAARIAFEQLGASPDLARIDARQRQAASRAGGLTPRERQVLRLVAAGMTNRAIAEELSLSERTVDRHLSNILTKLNVPSRAAATAYAYEHGLI